MRIGPRSLAAFRIAIGLLVLFDVALRALDLEAHYGETGVLPVRSVPAHYAHAYVSASLWGLHPAVVFVAAASAALALVLGYRTRVATAASWYLLLTIHARNPLVLSGGDSLLLLLLLWAVFLPLGSAWSLDARAGRLPRDLGPAEAIASVGLRFQVLATLFVSGVAKLGSPAWTSGHAIAWALHLRPTAVGARVLALPDAVLSGFARATLLLEIAGPIALVVLWQLPRVRVAALAVIAAMLVAIATALNVGILPLATLAGVSVFLPAGTWARRATPPVFDVRPQESSRSPAAVPAGIAAVASAWLLVTSVAFNARTLGVSDAPVLAPALGRVLGLDYRWQMFASLGRDAYWLQPRGERTGWAPVELAGPERGAPAAVVATRRRYGVRDYRWLRYEEGLLRAKDSTLLDEYGKYFCLTAQPEGGSHTKFESIGIYVGHERLSAENTPEIVDVELIRRVGCA